MDEVDIVRNRQTTAGLAYFAPIEVNMFIKFLWRNLRATLPAVFLALVPGVAHLAAQTVSVQPSFYQFPNVTVGLTSSVSVDFIVTNTGTTTLNIESMSLTGTGFLFDGGWTPYSMSPKFQSHYSVKFAPPSANTFSGSLTLNITGLAPIVLPLSGTGVSTGAVASVNVSAINFPNEALGSTASSSVTVTNTGTSNFTISAVTADPPFSVGTFKTAPLTPGSSAKINVNFAPSAVQTFTNALVISYDVLPPSGVSLSGTGVAPKKLGISTFGTLPAVTQGSKYIGNLQAAGGTPPYTWNISKGALPAGLSLSSAGSFSGIVTSTDPSAPYVFTAEVTDSAVPPAHAIRSLTLQVTKPSGANCKNITTNIPNTLTPITALNDLGTGTFLGSEGGLYPNGTNVRPPTFDAAGVGLANAILPLDGNGNSDPNGKYALISIGESNTSETYGQFMTDANADPAKNSHLVLVRGAQPRAGAAKFADPDDAVWNPIFQFFLPQAGVTAEQVVAAWVESVDRIQGTQPPFPEDETTLQSEYESIAQNLHSKFPNLRLVYFTSKFYDGYGTGVSDSIYPEPYGYESGFAVKWAIQDQINGNANLNWNPNNGPVLAPWMSWGMYDWANGLLARSDGLTWSCDDMMSDGVHPSPMHGMEKDANILLNFFKSDDTTAPWFLAPGAVAARGK
jgi:hypothetical protein